MNNIEFLAKKYRLEQWMMYSILTEAFFLALYPPIAAAAVVFGSVILFVRTRIDKLYKMRSLPFDFPVIFFFLISMMSVFVSSARNFELIYNYFSIAGVYALTYLNVGQTIRTPEQVKQVAKVLGVSAMIVVIYGLFQIFFNVDSADLDWIDVEAFPGLRTRIFSTLENPNVLAGYLNVFICLALGLLSKAEKYSRKIFLSIAIILFSICLVMTYSRGALLTIAMIFALFSIMKNWRIIIIFAAITTFIIFNDSNFYDRILSTFTLSDSSETMRIGIWLSTLAMISDHLFIGIGWGAFKFIYPQYNYYINDSETIIYHAHNIYLNYAAEIGIVGALAFFWYFFGTMFRRLRDTRSEVSRTNLDDKNFLDGFNFGVGLAFLSMSLNGLTDDLFFNIPSSMLMWMLGAISIKR